MSPTTVQLNTRIDAQVKRGGDVVFAREGLSPSEVVRGVWGYAAEHQEVPGEILDFIRGDGRSSRRDLACRGRGLALALAAGEHAPLPDDDRRPEAYDLEALRDEMYDDLLDEMEARCH